MEGRTSGVTDICVMRCICVRRRHWREFSKLTGKVVELKSSVPGLPNHHSFAMLVLRGVGTLVWTCHLRRRSAREDAKVREGKVSSRTRCTRAVVGPSRTKRV